MKNSLQGFEVKFANHRGKSFMVVAGDEINADRIINYQVEMISSNDIPGLLPPEIREKDSQVKLFYPVDGLVDINSHISRKRPGADELVLMLNSIASVLLQCSNYFLDQNSFILDVDHIFIDPITGTIKLLYLPIARNHNIDESFKSMVINLILNNMNVDVADPIALELLITAKQKEVTVTQFLNKVQHLSKPHSNHFHSSNPRPEKPYLHFQEEGRLTCSEHQQDPVESDHVLVSRGITVKNGWFNFHRTMKKRKLILIMLAVVSVLTAEVSVFADTGLSRAGLPMLKTIIGTLNDSRNSVLLAGLALILCGFYMFQKGSSKDQKEQNNIDQRRIAQRIRTPSSGLLPFLFHDTSDETVLLTEVKHPRLESLGDGEAVLINKPEFILGRHAGMCDHVINNKSIGRIHAKIRLFEGSYFITDLESKNGTYLNGEGLLSNKEYELKDKDVITLANMEYRFSLE